MIPVSGVTVNGAQLPSAVTGAEGVSRAPKEEPESAPQRPAMDEFIPEKKQEGSGRYWLERDENGEPQIRFDSPGQPDGPSREEGDTVRGSTDKVDREIEQLKQEKRALEQRISREDDEAKRGELERRLSQVENELRQKATTATGGSTWRFPERFS